MPGRGAGGTATRSAVAIAATIAATVATIASVAIAAVIVAPAAVAVSPVASPGRGATTTAAAALAGVAVLAPRAPGRRATWGGVGGRTLLPGLGAVGWAVGRASWTGLDPGGTSAEFLHELLGFTVSNFRFPVAGAGSWGEEKK